MTFLKKKYIKKNNLLFHNIKIPWKIAFYIKKVLFKYCAMFYSLNALESETWSVVQYSTTLWDDAYVCATQIKTIK